MNKKTEPHKKHEQPAKQLLLLIPLFNGVKVPVRTTFRAIDKRSKFTNSLIANTRDFSNNCFAGCR
jgi:hypothetical protein